MARRKLMGKRAAAEVAARLGITDEDVKTIVGAAHQVWNDIAYDVFTSMEGPSSIPRSHVVELVLDASRWEKAVSRPRRYRGGPAAPLSPGITNLLEAIKKDYTTNMNYVESVVTASFTYARYGL